MAEAERASQRTGTRDTLGPGGRGDFRGRIRTEEFRGHVSSGDEGVEVVVVNILDHCLCRCVPEPWG